MSVWNYIVIMAMAQLQDHPTDVLPAESGQTAAHAEFHDKLHVLFAEVTALANHSRRMAASPWRQAHSPAGGWSVLQVLDRQGPLTVPAIARIRTVSRQSIQTEVNRLGTHGYVALTANPAHKRSGLVHLTDRGRGLLAAVTERESRSSEALLPYISETRLVSAARLLHRLRELLTGKGLPPAEVTGARPARKRAETLPKAAHRSEAGPGPTDLPRPPEPAEPDEAEFPISLL
jgi:DNA-binding MarR family transcriptional regulator